MGGGLFTRWIERFEQGQKVPRILKEDNPLDPGDIPFVSFME